MRHVLILAAVLMSAGPAFAQNVATPIASLDTTLTGQPIVAPGGNLRVSVSEMTIPAGGKLAPHKHPYIRIVKVLEGRLQVTNLEDGKVHEVTAGEWLLDSMEQWHDGAVQGDGPVRLLIIDEAPPGARVTIPKPN